MGIILKNKRHLLTRFPFWLSIIIFLALAPFIIGFTGAYLSELITNKPCNEGNCIWGVIPWFGVMFTLPIGGVALVIYLIIIIMDALKIMNNGG